MFWCQLNLGNNLICQPVLHVHTDRPTVMYQVHFPNNNHHNTYTGWPILSASIFCWLGLPTKFCQIAATQANQIRQNVAANLMGHPVGVRSFLDRRLWYSCSRSRGPSFNCDVCSSRDDYWVCVQCRRRGKGAFTLPMNIYIDPVNQIYTHERY